MSDPVPMLSIVIFYHYFVHKLGPALMAKREPFNLTNTLIIYNFVQVLISVYLFLEGARLAWFKDYNWLCQPVDHGTSPVAMSIATACYTYFLAKISELLDTVFFVLRKKEKQITFLHLYHHTVMPIISWGCTKYYPGGHGTFIGFINSFVHIIMYSYYLLAAMGPSVHKYLWWKKYVTTLQLLQFCIAFLHSSLLFFYDCGYPRFSLWFTVPNTIFFYLLFSDFYGKAYRKSSGTVKGEHEVTQMTETSSAVKTDITREEDNNNIRRRRDSKVAVNPVDSVGCASEKPLNTRDAVNTVSSDTATASQDGPDGNFCTCSTFQKTAEENKSRESECYGSGGDESEVKMGFRTLTSKDTGPISSDHCSRCNKYGFSHTVSTVAGNTLNGDRKVHLSRDEGWGSLIRTNGASNLDRGADELMNHVSKKVS